MKKHVCDICGQEFEKGITFKGILKGIAPWKKRMYMCDKCQKVAQLLILGYRRGKGI